MIKVVHVMMDGSRKDSLKGITVPINDTTMAAYKIVAESRKYSKQVAV